MADPENFIKNIPPQVIQDIYDDGFKGLVKEFGKLGVDLIKTFRLTLIPIQYIARLQDKIQAALDRVPENNRVKPVESIFLQIIDKLKFQDEGSIINEMYIQLLACSIDKDKAENIHPATLFIISQLAPDEVNLIDKLSRHDISIYFQSVDSNHVKLDENLTFKEIENAIKNSSLIQEEKNSLIEITINPEILSLPQHIYTYIDHLSSLGVLDYSNKKSYISV
ncbi:MAG: DUF4393 domain-containing protein [Enterobacteriaceae bacterium]|jgi:hypothetical protein|nr:DUF4393 domain-containing protein [Enterobacteriaceae bacterium]